MKFYLAIFLLLVSSPAYAQSEADAPQASSSTTIPVTHTDATGMPNTGVVITQPMPENTIKPVPVAPQQTPAEIAADQALRKQADQDVSAYAARVADGCGASFTARIDWTTVSPLQTHRYSPADACGAALQAIDELCENSTGRDRVAQEIKSVICTTGAQPSIEMHGGTLVYTIDWQSVSPGERIYTWLATHL